MNYLIVEGYRDAAEHFVQESGTEANVDLSTIKDRVAIRKVRPLESCYMRTATGAADVADAGGGVAGLVVRTGNNHRAIDAPPPPSLLRLRSCSQSCLRTTQCSMFAAHQVVPAARKHGGFGSVSYGAQVQIPA